MNTTEAVRGYAAVNGTVTKRDAKAALELSVDQVVYAFETLVKQGYLRKIRHGLYQFVDQVKKPAIEINDKIWRAMKISPTFTADDIAKLAESTTSYVYKRFRQYREDGYLRQHGNKRNPGVNPKKVWRLTLKGKERANQPNLETFVPDPLVMAAVNLNRLVCSRVAMRDEEAGVMAMDLARQIIKGLEDAATS